MQVLGEGVCDEDLGTKALGKFHAYISNFGLMHLRCYSRGRHTQPYQVHTAVSYLLVLDLFLAVVLTGCPSPEFSCP